LRRIVRTSGGVNREGAGEAQMGNHLCLLVRIDQTYLVEVGFGGSLSQPLPLNAAEHRQPPYHLSLADLGNGYWRFAERTHGKPFSFDFRLTAADEMRFRDKCIELQTSPASPLFRILLPSDAAAICTYSCAAAC
jgi:N-hydroxyarylamine O-acetyltransferase